jgi:sugar phosphate isomerase/epimerase
VFVKCVEAVSGEYHGYELCTGLYITGGDPVAEIARFSGKINFVQIRDLAGRWPEALEVFPGTGDLDVPAILEALVAAGYSGFLHPEHPGAPAPCRRRH